MFEYDTAGVCPRKISFEIEDGKLKGLVFYGGCEGNLKALSKLLEGAPVEEVVEKLKGIECKARKTSCVDQLVKAIENAMDQQHSV